MLNFSLGIVELQDLLKTVAYGNSTEKLCRCTDRSDRELALDVVVVALKNIEALSNTLEKKKAKLEYKFRQYPDLFSFEGQRLSQRYRTFNHFANQIFVLLSQYRCVAADLQGGCEQAKTQRLLAQTEKEIDTLKSELKEQIEEFEKNKNQVILDTLADYNLEPVYKDNLQQKNVNYALIGAYEGGYKIKRLLPRINNIQRSCEVALKVLLPNQN